MNVVSRTACWSKRIALFVLWSAVLMLMSPVNSSAQTYTSDTNIADFTSVVGTYATLSNYNNIDGGCGSPSFTPTATELAVTGCRVYYGGTLSGLPGNNWLLASFPNQVSSIIVFPSIDHYGSAYDGYQYTIYGSNDLQTWTPLFDAVQVSNSGEPFTLVESNGTRPTTVNNVLTPQSVGLPSGCSGTATPCAIGYIAQFTFGAAYQYYAFGPSTVAMGSGNADQELSAVGSTQSQITTLPVEGPINVSNDFSNSAGTLQQTIVIPSSNNNPFSADHIISTNQAIACDPSNNYAVWRQYVVGTPWAVSHCAPHAANGPNTGALYVNACWSAQNNQSVGQASDAFCPTVNPDGSQGNIILEDTFDWIKEAIVNGATASLVAFTPPTDNPYLAWTASTDPTNPVCATLTNCYLFDTLKEMYGDQTTTRGTSPKTKSWNVTALDVPTALTSVYASPNTGCPLTTDVALNNPDPSSPNFESPTYTVDQQKWFNGNCLIKFVVNQAQVPASLQIAPNGNIGPNNNFVAAPVSSFLYGLGAQNADADTTIPNKTPSPQFVPTLNGLTLGSFLGGDGPAKSFHWSSVDLAGIVEKNIQLLPVDDSLTCPVPADVTGGPVAAPPGGQCYITSPFTVQANLDSVAPTVSITPHPGGTNIPFGQAVTADYTCTDALSGVANCSYQIDNGPVVNGPTSGASGFALPGTVGNHTFTVTASDLAMNPATPQVYAYTVVSPAADMALYEGYSYDVVKHGTTYNYPAWALDLTKGVAAQGVTVTGTVTIPTSSLSGNISAKVAIVSCSSSTKTCSSMTVGSACSLTGSSVSGSNTIQTVSCNVGALQSVYNVQGARVQLMIPVSSTAKLYSTFRIDAVVSSANDPNAKNNAVCDIITVK